MSKELQFLIDSTPRDNVKIDVVVHDKTLWLTQKAMARLFDVQVPDGRGLKSGVTIAKNHLPEKDIKRLERMVSGYFDYIEDLIERENTFTMEQFAESVNAFLAFRKYQILEDKGKISKQHADGKAEAEYEAFNKTQKIISDFDKTIKALKQKEKKLKKEGKP